MKVTTDHTSCTHYLAQKYQFAWTKTHSSASNNMEFALLSQGSILWAISNAKFNQQVYQISQLQHQPMGNLDAVWQCPLLISFVDRLLDAWSQLVEIHNCTELIFTIPGIMKIQTIHSTPSNWQFIATSFPHEPFKDNNIITIVLLMFNI